MDPSTRVEDLLGMKFRILKKRISVTVDEELVRELDKERQRLGITRSRLLEETLRDWIRVAYPDSRYRMDEIEKKIDELERAA